MEADKVPQECDLALSLVEECFGDAVERVCRIVIERGNATLRSIAKGSGLPASAVKQCLLILIKHNIVSSFRSLNIHAKRQDSGQTRFIYVARPSYVLSLLNFPKWLLKVRQELGELAEAIIESLVEHGRLNQSSMVSLVTDKMGTNYTQDGEEIQREFSRLAREHLIEHSPSCRLPPPWFFALDASVKRGHKGLKSELGEMNNAQNIANSMYAESERTRFTVDSDDDDGEGCSLGNGGVLDKDVVMAGTSGGKSPGATRRHRNGSSSMDVDGAPMDAKVKCEDGIFLPGVNGGDEAENGITDKNMVTWRINVDEFKERFKEDLCLEMMKDGSDSVTAHLFEGIMQARRHKRHMANANTELISLQEITHSVTDVQDLDSEAKVLEAIRALEDYPLCSFLRRFGPDEGVYVLNLEGLVRLMQLNRADSLVEEKFGPKAKRVFRLLRKQRVLEERAISSNAMLTMKETREILYRLFNGHYVHLYEVPREPSHMPSRTFYLWYVDEDLMIERCKVDMYEIALKLHQRFKYELSRSKDVTDMIEAAFRGQQKNTQERIMARIEERLTDEQKARLERSRRVTIILEGTMLRVNELISVFSL